MKKIALTNIACIAIMLTSSLSAQTVKNKSLTGSWLGKISVGAVEMRLVFNLKINEKDSLIATLDSPDQGAKNIPLGQVICESENITIKAPLMLAEYTGEIKNDTTIDGSWTQRGAKYPVNLKKLKTAFTLNRPQEPNSKLPYISDNVTFINNKANITLAGTLTIPEGDGPFPAVVLITGSGGQNRNEEILGHKPFLVISDWLTKHGIAVLRYDDRGIGQSKGSQLNTTSADFADDAEAAFRFLKTNPKINPAMTGLAGHSEGGLIAPIIASSNKEVAFIVALAGPGVSGQQIIIRQSQDIGKLSGMTEEQVNKAAETNKKLYVVLQTEKDNNKAEEKIIALYKEILVKEQTREADIQKAVGQLKASFGASSYTWLRYFLFTDPAEYWKKVKCPVLALNGEKDLQVAAKENLPAIQKALKSSGNNSVTIREFPGLNHLFQHCSKGLPSEYGEIEETFSPEVLQVISDWILNLKISR